MAWLSKYCRKTTAGRGATERVTIDSHDCNAEAHFRIIAAGCEATEAVRRYLDENRPPDIRMAD